MLAKLRSQLRAKGICKKPKEKFGITCVYSIDNPFSSADVSASAGLRCGGYGSAVVVTSSFCDGRRCRSVEKVRSDQNKRLVFFK